MYNRAMNTPKPNKLSRMIPILTAEEVSQMRSADDVPAIVARRPDRRYIETPINEVDAMATAPTTAASRHGTDSKDGVRV
jgi:hypothetical protein